MSLSNLIDKGLELAGGFLSTLREKDERDAQFKSESLEQQKFFNDRLLSSIEDVSRQISEVASDTAFRVTQKIESDRLEDLSAQIKLMSLAIQVGNESMLGNALSSISIQIEYAKNRIKEGKSEWLGAWMMAESMRLTGLCNITTGPQGAALINKEAQNFRICILNFTKNELICGESTPWLQIAQFVEGKSEDVLGLINLTEKLAIADGKIVSANSIKMPEVTEACSNYDVIGIFVEPGQKIQKGDSIVTIETDKIIYDVPADTDGYVIEVLVKLGDKASPGDVLLTIA